MAAPVEVSIDASVDGLGTSTQQVLSTGVVEVGWLDAGTTFNDMIGFLTPGGPNFNLVTARERFNTVATMTFTPATPNSFAPGLVQENITLVQDGDAASLTAYRNAATGAAGKRMYAWVRNGASESTASQQAFVESTAVFPTASDTVLFSDFGATLGLDAGTISASNVGVGLQAMVQTGGGVDLNAGSPADGLGAFGSPTVLLTDSFSTAPSLAFAPTSLTVSEIDGTATLTVVRSGSLTGSVTVNFTTLPGSALAGTDFTTTSGTLTFGTNVTSQPIPVTILNRPGFQTSRQFTVTLSGQSTGDITADTATVTITDNVQPAGTLQFSAAAYNVNENTGPAVLSVTRTGGTYGPLSATISTANVSATAGQDYTALNSVPVNFADGDGVTQTVNVPITDDPDFEGNETFTATLTGGALGSPAAATVTIVENEMPPTIGTLSFANAGAFSVQENGGTATITVNRSSGSVGDTSVTYDVTPFSAVQDVDYNGTASPLTGTLSWVGADTTPKSFQVAIVNNQADAADKEFRVTLSNPTNGAVVTGANPATVTIVDDDVAGALGWSATTASVAENAGQATLTINRTGGSSGTVLVTVNTSGGSPGTDYTPVLNLVVSFAHGQLSRTVNVPIKNDTVFKGDRTFDVTLSNPTNGATLGANVTVTVTITDDELPKPGTLSMAVSTLTVNEPAGSVDFTVFRAKGLDGPVSVNYTLTGASSGPSATEGSDYTGTGGVINFAPNENSRTVSIPIINDTDIEKNEKFNIVLSGPTGGATLGTKKKTVVTIVSEDALGTLTVTPSALTVTEGGTATITVVRANELDKTFLVNYSTAAGTAGLGSDFTPVSGTLTFGPNVTSLPVTIGTITDNIPENPETFTFSLKLPNLAQTVKLVNPSSATITIDRNGAIDAADNLVAVKGSSFVGNNVYNASGDGQIASRTTSSSSTVTFVLRVQNDGNLRDSYKVAAVSSGTATQATVRYYRNGTEITGQITDPNGGYIVSALESGSTADIEVQVKFSGSSRFTGYGATLTTSSVGTPAKTDVARVIGIVQ